MGRLTQMDSRGRLAGRISTRKDAKPCRNPKGNTPASSRDDQNGSRRRGAICFDPLHNQRGWNIPMGWTSPPRRDAASSISRDTTVVAVLGIVTPEIAAARTSNAVVLPVSAWVWFRWLPGGGAGLGKPRIGPGCATRAGDPDFRVVSGEESIGNLCAEQSSDDIAARKPQKTAADYMVVALSPALIMAGGRHLFFLISILPGADGRLGAR